MLWWVALLLAALYGALSAALFALGCLRGRRDDRPVEQRPDPLWAAFQEQIFSGARWWDAQATEPVTIRSHDGLALHGALLQHPEARGTVLLFQGYRSQGRVDFSCAFRPYYAMGFSLLLVDQRAHGESGGRVITLGVKERRDCLAWAEYAAARFGGDHPLILDGMSMGAATVLLAAALPLPPSVRGIIADSGYVSPREEVRYLLRERLRLPLPGLWLFGIDAAARIFGGFRLGECSTVEALAGNTRPLLLVHGGADTFVPARFSEMALAASGGEKELLLVPGAGHGTGYLVDTPRCAAALERFLLHCTEEGL